MPWVEALRLIGRLSRDPSSAIAAELAGWDYPIDRTTLAVLDLYDLQTGLRWVDGGKKGSRPAPHPGRPYKSDDRATTRRGNAGSRTPAEVKAILAQFGHPPV